MTKNNTPEKAVEPEPSPVPMNRMVQPAMVRVRARRLLGESIAGKMTHFKPGDVFELPPDRAKALGPLVEPV
jgi:hypothetical protein